MAIIITKCAAYDSNARLGLDNSNCILCQITSDAFISIKKNYYFDFDFSDDRLLAGHNRALD